MLKIAKLKKYNNQIIVEEITKDFHAYTDILTS